MLAAAVKRKLLLFHYDGKDFVELREAPLPEAPLCAAWSGNYVCLGCKGSCVPSPFLPSAQPPTCQRTLRGLNAILANLLAGSAISCFESCFTSLHHFAILLRTLCDASRLRRLSCSPPGHRTETIDAATPCTLIYNPNRSDAAARRYLVVHAETGAAQELCEIARDTPPALLTLPSGDVLLSRDATSRFLGPRSPLAQACKTQKILKAWHVSLCPARLEYRSIARVHSCPLCGYAS